MTTPFRTTAATLMVGLFASLLAVVPATTANAEADPRTSQSANAKPTTGLPATFMPAEQAVWKGKANGAKKAKTVLQVAQGRKWKKVATVRTDAKGVFSAVLTGAKTPGTTKYRLVLAKKTVARRTVTTVAQTATLSEPVDIGGNQVEMTATFTPARPGRKVSLMNYSDGAWHFGPNKTQSASGQVTYKVTRPGTGGSITVRASTAPYNGAAAANSDSRLVLALPSTTPTPTPTASPTATPTPPPPGEFDPLPEVAPLSSTEAESIESYDSNTGTMRLGPDAPASVRNAEPGTIIAVPASDATPYGALRKVLSTSTAADGSTTIETETGVLAEAIAATSDAPQDIALEHVGTQVVDLADGVTITDTPIAFRGDTIPNRLAKRAESIRVTSPKGLHFNVEPEPHAVNGGTISISGTLDLFPQADLAIDPEIDWDWRDTKVVTKSYKFGAGANVKNELTVALARSGQSGEFEKEFTLGTLSHRFKGMAGPVPVWVTVTQRVLIEISASGSIGVEVVVTTTGDAMAGVENTAPYNTSPKRYTEMPSDSGVALTAGANGSVEAFAGYRLTTMLYDVAGPTFQVGVEAAGEGSIGVPIEFSKDFDWRTLGRWDFASCEFSVGPKATLNIALADALQELIGTEVSFDLWESDWKPWWEFECPDPEDKPKIATASLLDATTGTTYLQYLRTMDSRAGEWTITDGRLPAGLQMANGIDGTVATIYGTPTASGTSTFTLRMRDELGRASTKTYTIETTTGDDWIRIGAIDTAASVDEPFTTALNASSGPGYSQVGFLLKSGTLPIGTAIRRLPGEPLSLVITGTPRVMGTFTFTIEAVGLNDDLSTAACCTGQRTFTIEVGGEQQPYLIEPGSVGQPYSGGVGPFYVSYSGVGDENPFPVTWSLVEGSLPPGMVMSTSDTGRAEFSGTPTAPGGYTFVLRQTDMRGAKQRYNVAILIKDPARESEPRPSYLQVGTSTIIDDLGSFPRPDGGYTGWRWEWVSGQMPPGMSLMTSPGANGSTQYRLGGTPTKIGAYWPVLALLDEQGDEQGRFVYQVVVRRRE